MIDIIWVIREKIFRRPAITPVVAWEELSEKQTTKLWYFLLYCMFFAILATWQWSLSIIKSIPTAPQQVPSCIHEVLQVLSSDIDTSSYYYWGSYWCILTTEYPQYDFTQSYNKLQPIAEEINRLKKQLQDYKNQRNSLQQYKNNTQADYNTSLTEKIAGENSGVFDNNTLRDDLSIKRRELANAESGIISTESQIRTILQANSKEIEVLKGLVKVAQDDYQKAYLIYRLITAILSFTFALLVFFTLYHFYVKQKTKNSPYTVIFSVATFAYGLIVLQVFLLFLWDIIPHEFFNVIFRFLKNLTFIVYILQFLWPIIIVWVFWFLVYKIQKRLYSPENILKRFIADKKCPNCGNAVDFTKPFCPLCSHEIQIHCKECNSYTVKGMNFCSSCGKKPN